MIEIIIEPLIETLEIIVKRIETFDFIMKMECVNLIPLILES